MDWCLLKGEPWLCQVHSIREWRCSSGFRDKGLDNIPSMFPGFGWWGRHCAHWCRGREDPIRPSSIRKCSQGTWVSRRPNCSCFYWTIRALYVDVSSSFRRGNSFWFHYESWSLLLPAEAISVSLHQQEKGNNKITLLSVWMLQMYGLYHTKSWIKEYTLRQGNRIVEVIPKLLGSSSNLTNCLLQTICDNLTYRTKGS